ncbi:MAG: RNA 2',3'-cyclic phosphodiesterase [Elusimicrobiota bacterium]
MRLFVTVGISAENKNRISEVQSALKKNQYDIKWTELGNLHLTLKFLGEVEENKIAEITEKLKNAIADTKKFEIIFYKLGIFPNNRFPRVLWVGVENGEQELKSLSEKIETALEPLGFEKEKRAFSAHLTLGRFRSPKNNEKLVEILKKIQIEKMLNSVSEILLIKSTLTPKGPIYETIKEFKLEEK